MAVEINRTSDNNYFGNLTAAAEVAVGVFVVPDFSAGTAAVPADDTAADAAGLMLVANVNDNIDEQGVADADLTVASGSYLRLKPLQVHDTFTTDKFKGTYATLNVDDVFAIGDGGTVEAIGVRTPAMRFAIAEKTTLFGNEALKLRVTQI